MSDKTRTIEVYFPVDVELPDNFEQELSALIDVVCKKYEKENAGRVMWPASIGGKMLSNPFMSDDLEFDMSCLCIEVAEREDY